MSSIINIGLVNSPPHMEEVVGYRCFFFYYLALGQAHSRRRALDPHILYISRFSFAQGCAFLGVSVLTAAQAMRLRNRTSSMWSKLLRFVFRGLITDKLPQREFPSQNTPCYNFLTTQPIHTNSNLIDEARQVEHRTKLKHVKNFSLGEQFLRKFPQRVFL